MCPGDPSERSGLSRSGALSRSRKSKLARNTRIKPVSDTNAEHPSNDPGLREFARRLPCCVCGDPPPSDPAHVKSRGAGHSDWIEVDGEKVGNVAPLDRACHRLQHDRGIKTFEGMTGVDLAAEARATGESYLAS